MFRRFHSKNITWSIQNNNILRIKRDIFNINMFFILRNRRNHCIILIIFLRFLNIYCLYLYSYICKIVNMFIIAY